MAFPIQDKLVVAVASSAQLNHTESDAVFAGKGAEAYREYQRKMESETLSPGVAFSFIRRLLTLNRPDEDDEPVEVILLSRNDPDTGLRVMSPRGAHGLPISRAVFVSGGDPFKYIEAFNASRFLSADERNVKE